MLNACKRLQRALVLIILSVCVYCVHVKADIWPLVLNGDAVPGTANFRFLGSFSQPVVNAAGTVVFSASLVDPATNLTGSGLFEIAGGQLITIALSGGPLPDVPGQFTGAGSPAINDSGDIVFVGGTTEKGIHATFDGIFEFSNGVIRRVMDFDTPAPWPQGECLGNFGSLQFNNQGAIAFQANFIPCSNGSVAIPSGFYIYANGSVQQIAVSDPGTNQLLDSFSLNNRGDLAFSSGGPSASIFVYSGGSIKPVVNTPQAIPGTTLTAQSLSAPSMNDNGDIVFTSLALAFTGQRGSGFTFQPNALVRWSNGALQKIVAPGDPVPGFASSVFGSSGFAGVHQADQAAVIFSDATTTGPSDPPFGYSVIGRYQNGQLSTVASSNEYVDNIGTLDNVQLPVFDTQQGPLIAFTAAAAARAQTGIYAATAAQQYTLRFPHIADGGGGAAGGWRTTFVLANRSATAANATLGFYDDNGNPLSLMIGGTAQTQTSIVVPALGVAEVQTQGGGPLTVGWALVQADQNLTGIGIFGLLDSFGNSISEVGVPGSLPLSSMSVFAQNGATTSTGVALANPNATAAAVTLTLKDSNSTQLAQTSVTIPPMGHLAEYASQMFTALPPGEFQGKIEVLSTQPLAGLTLRQNGSNFTSLPVIP